MFSNFRYKYKEVLSSNDIKLLVVNVRAVGCTIFGHF